ncbi:hypothetical protein CG402_03400 [Bifidobacteriaceae bacterium NR020]|nr:hypothetical protein CG402_03400 [Bifidobacteriaceae bacterium NR020]
MVIGNLFSSLTFDLSVFSVFIWFYMVLCALLTTLFVKHALVANHITLRRVWLIVSLGVLFAIIV